MEFSGGAGSSLRVDRFEGQPRSFGVDNRGFWVKSYAPWNLLTRTCWLLL
jgi:hypothetical protein